MLLWLRRQPRVPAACSGNIIPLQSVSGKRGPRPSTGVAERSAIGSMAELCRQKFRIPHEQLVRVLHRACLVETRRIGRLACFNRDVRIPYLTSFRRTMAFSLTPPIESVRYVFRPTMRQQSARRSYASNRTSLARSGGQQCRDGSS